MGFSMFFLDISVGSVGSVRESFCTMVTPLVTPLVTPYDKASPSGMPCTSDFAMLLVTPKHFFAHVHKRNRPFCVLSKVGAYSRQSRDLFASK